VVSSLNPAGVAEYAEAIVIASSLLGALLSLHAAIATVAIAIPTMWFVFTVRILFGVRKQDTRQKKNPDALRA
jgi:hypothetical protein